MFSLLSTPWFLHQLMGFDRNILVAAPYGAFEGKFAKISDGVSTFPIKSCKLEFILLVSPNFSTYSFGFTVKWDDKKTKLDETGWKMMKTHEHYFPFTSFTLKNGMGSGALVDENMFVIACPVDEYTWLVLMYCYAETYLFSPCIGVMFSYVCL